MPKLLWVLLPLLIAAALLGWRLLRKRAPSRKSLNIGFSVLLLAYLATTAGLGIFWVANQQLPVFDWHYLFGYATLLLVLLHLGFNGRIVWRYFVRPRPAAPPGAAAQRPARRRAFGLALAALAAGAAYWLGLRHGRDAATPLARSADDLSAPSALAEVERYHQLSANSRRGVVRVPGIDWGDAPAPFKPAAEERVTLPPPHGAAPGRIDLATLSALLWHTAGISGSAGTLKLRTSPSSGALFPAELYVAAIDVDALAPACGTTTRCATHCRQWPAVERRRRRRPRWARSGRRSRPHWCWPARCSSAPATSTATAAGATCWPTWAMRWKTCA
jgi:cytochrome b561